MIDPTVSKLKVYNTLSRSLEEFDPVRPGRINMFVCGPTVWDSSHVGHAKTYIAYDIMARYLRHKGFSIFFILNITDIDDKRPVEDVVWSDEAYQEVYKLGGLEIVKTYRPLAKEIEPINWVNETRIAPWVIYVLKRCRGNSCGTSRPSISSGW